MTVLGPRIGFAATVTLTPDDTFINLNTDINAGDPQLNLYTWPATMIANAILMKLDLSSIPAGANVDSATLLLYLTEWDSSADTYYTVTVHRIINVDPDLASADGHTYDGVNGWTANSCCNNGVPLAQADIGPAVDSRALDKVAGFKSFDVTALVQTWHATPSENYGLMLNSDPTRDAGQHRYFASTENTDAGQHPYLEIQYTLPGDSDGGPTGGDTGFVGANEANCEAGEYYDLGKGLCIKPTAPSRGCSATGGAISLSILLALFGVRRRRRRRSTTLPPVLTVVSERVPAERRRIGFDATAAHCKGRQRSPL